LCDIASGQWDPWLCKRFELDQVVLPDVLPIEHRYGNLRGSPVFLTAVNGDQNAAVYACGPLPSGTVLVNLGTGAFILATTGVNAATHPDLLVSRSRSDNNRAEYVIEGTVNGAGAALSWAADSLGIAAWSNVDLQGWLQTEPATVFINSVGGLGSPFWCDGPGPHWRNTSGQVTVPAGPAGMAAVAESIVFLLRINCDCLRDAGIAISQLRVGGGLADVDALCQRLANLCAIPVVRPVALEATALGIAWLAAGGPADWDPPGQLDRFAPVTDAGLMARFDLFKNYIDTRRGGAG
jgi:glycerol kinase